MTDPFDRNHGDDDRLSEETADAEPDGSFPEPVDPGPGVAWGLVLFLIVSVFLVIFAVQNTQSVTLRLLAWEWQVPLAIIVLVTAVLAVLLDEVLGSALRKRRHRRRLEREELRRLRSRGE